MQIFRDFTFFTCLDLFLEICIMSLPPCFVRLPGPALASPLSYTLCVLAPPDRQIKHCNNNVIKVYGVTMVKNGGSTIELL